MSNDGVMTRMARLKESVKLPSCEWKCGRTAQYDFVDKNGHWRYGCTQHWMDHRLSKQLGAGHARHLSPGVEPPKRPADAPESPPLDPTVLARPKIAMTLREQLNAPSYIGTDGSVDDTPRSKAKAHVVKKQSAEKKVRVREFFDMEPTSDEVKAFKPGSVMAITVDLMKEKDGATLDEIQNAIGPKHQALKLLQWMNENRGIGFKKGEDGKIRPWYRSAG